MPRDSPEMVSKEDVHVGQSLCVLCRQAATAGSPILDLNRRLRTVPDCGSPCARCSLSPSPIIWFHATCYEILQNSYESSQRPTPEDLRRFADATRPVYRCHPQEHRETMSVTDGLLSKYTRKKLPKRVFDKTCWVNYWLNY
ncbi:hypothetical protein BDW42DRAFT_6311 [Aspergillus taichungensis]|uniref:Uncharacterized protein n=1 Tax=Aspergillus taichungensis TaxID=482145 RepID=A0A2J5HJJ1_9EURO|nr:hypothetical protein BDW42DRAFT_6311 [Aspergillus taichungensis]